MMNTTHFFDPAMASYAFTGARKRKYSLTALLERLGICRSPRILSAICLAGESPASAGS